MDRRQLGIIVAVVCIVIAGAITYFQTAGGGPKGIEAIPASEMMWLKCDECGAEYQIPKREYYKFLQENQVGPTAPPMKCNECGKEAVYRAVKCEECGNIFFYGAAGQGEFPDKCPECGYSKTEERRKQNR